MKRIALVLLVLCLSACSTEPVRWDNHYIHFYPDNMNVLYVRHGNTKFKKENNGENYNIEFETYKKDNTLHYRLSVTSYNHDIDYGWFTGFDNTNKDGSINPNAEINWKTQNRTMSSSGKLKESEFYELSLSRDKFN